jgi:predicted O-methyltransferase YrrM
MWHVVRVSEDGTDSYDGLEGLPPLVEAAVELARSRGFALSCLPEQGRLLQLLAGGLGEGTVGETGTGCGVGLAWMATAAAPTTRLVSIEADPDRAEAARALFSARRNVEVLCGDWTELVAHGPFDLLVLDGGGQGKQGADSFDPHDWLRPGATFVIDDLTPMATWPPSFRGRADTTRLRWFDDERVLATEVQLRSDAATLVAKWRVGLPPSEER